ncbi:unnamed protein product [Rotaria magnacalcarata]|uniref:C-type lectin domain-containing protein n=1 Tax=Rotaria magnacalcarata TaxID=392030 RepID=A0A816B9N6_9BILA|nr:unnamed protein product [Rotaria magnacalcarata]CAF1606153.1 unnamed protein product [Rotaria magnacalcarata]
MLFLFLLIVSPLLSYSSISDEWHSKSQCTQKEFANHMDISCNSNEFILIGWSHYGTKKLGGIRSLTKQEQQPQQRCEPSESDCIMDYTHKIAELCNGVSKCEVILTQQFIHKCSDEATYLFISYQCINNSTIVDVCAKSSMISSNGLNLISPLFPNEYPNNVNCTCTIEPIELNKQSLSINIDAESLSFNLQDNDYLSSSKSLSLSGTIPFGASLFNEKTFLGLTFTTDETLSQSGFWIRLHGYYQCNHDEYSLGSKCIKIFQQKQTWNNAQEKCFSIGSRLIHLHDIVQEKKLAYFLLTNYEQQQASFWISDAKEKYDIHSWWPWRLSINEGKCVLRTQDGWIKRPCDELQSFICERDINRQSIPLAVRCGNAQAPLSSTITTTTTSSSSPTTTITTTTRRPTDSFIQPPIVQGKITLHVDKQNYFTSAVTPSINTEPIETVIETKSNSIDPNILAAVLGGIALVIFSVNIIVCYICKRRTKKTSKCKTPIESQSSFTHEELQRSLMQHLYHEQTNTISSTSTSSSSSKHSQSKSNDTSTTTTANVNLLQLCSPPHTTNSSQSYMTRSNVAATALCFRNPHAAIQNNGDPVDYHFYETIPSENANYNICATHSAFKPVLQSNSHTIRPFLPRTNIFYHPPGSTKQFYDTTPSAATTSAVLMPVCCHHHLSQCSTGTLRHHVSSRIIPPPPPPPIITDEQTYMGSESITEQGSIIRITGNLNEKEKIIQFINHVKTFFTITEMNVIDTLTQTTFRVKFEHKVEMEVIKWIKSFPHVALKLAALGSHVTGLSFNLQDNDYLSSSKSLSLSGTIPFGASLFNEKTFLGLTFTTDETLSQSGFWIRLHGYYQCNHDEYSLGSKCIKIFQQKQTWNNAQEKCFSIGSRLIHLHDIVQEKKLAYFLLTNYEQQQASFWISDAKEKYDIHSWWPWRLSINEGKCVLRTQDGWIKRPCDELQSFICERDINRQSIPLAVRCGNAQAPLSSTITTTTTSSSSPTTTITTTTRRPTDSFIQPPIVQGKITLHVDKQNYFTSAVTPSINTEPIETVIETKSNSIDPNILAAVLGGIALVIFSVNIIVCYICKRYRM